MIAFKSVTVSCLFLLLSFHGHSQLFAKKYVRKNKDAPITQYADSGMYARGLYVDSTLLYIGNSNGAIYRYDTEKNTSFLLAKYPSFTEVRDIEVGNGFIYGMQSGDNGKLIKIGPKGPTGFVELPEWKGVFFDAFDFEGEVGFLMGDPVDGIFTLFHTKNGGKSWERCAGDVKAITGEAGFAASGSNVRVMNDSTYMFISGGMSSNFYKSTNSGASWTRVQLPYYPAETIGAYSMCFSDEKIGVIVGGNYKQPELKMNTTYYTSDGGETWYNAITPPNGYRSCVYFVDGIYYACGRNGIDYSDNNGKDWIPFAEGAFFSMTSVNNKLIATMQNARFQTFELVDP